MTVEDCILFYKKTKCINRECHLNWLKENVNPILKTINPKLNISWSCQTCAKNYMNMLVGWLDTKEKEKIKNEPKKKTSVARKKKKQTKKKN